MLSKLLKFIKHDIWRMRLKDLDRSKSLLIKPLRILLLALRGFNEDKCQLRASALTFYSLLSIVPVVAMAFGVAKGFGFQETLQDQLLNKIPGQEEVMLKIVNFAHSLLANTRGGLVAGIGVAILFWTVIKVLGNIEKSFNDIWGVKQQRSIGRKFSDYLSIMLICPILIIASSSATVFLTTQIKVIITKVEFLGAFSPLILSTLKILPYCIIWLVFSFIYIFMPNSKVNLKSGIIAGIVAGTIYQLVQWGYVNFQVGVSKFNAIYGSFAALPLFLVWLQISWLIVLLGAEISFADQNVDTYEFEPDCLNISYSFKRLLTLEVMNLLVVNFSKCRPTMTADQISHSLDIPIRLVREIIFELSKSGMISGVQTAEYKEIAYQPACDINKLTIKRVINSLEDTGVDDIPVAKTRQLEVISKKLEVFDKALENSSSNTLLKDI
ncbi:MAG: YihY/virulence factor BrkB family protein [Candidatus Omnitrophica bacterium]|nr:YihY/virulence factor BrkB family protein [Candidatus Omnitrophota bacterium]MCF7894371.1 YihY/virulence factor BrkB family protein [Candidatus Omnitrophota bacterium]